MPDAELSDVAVFAHVVEAGGFTAAARVLQAPKSSISRRVSRLEGSLGTRLLQRTTRSVSLTEAGQAYYERVAAALAALDEAAAVAAETVQSARGVVRLAAPPDVGGEVLPVLLARFCRRHPEVEVEVTLSATLADVVEGRFDLALRNGRYPADTALVVTRLQKSVFRLYAAPDYLAGRAAPRTRDELPEHQCVLFRPEQGRCRWRLYDEDTGDSGDVVVRGPIRGNDMSFVRRAAAAGAGIALLPDLVGDRAVASGHLAPVLPRQHGDGESLYLVHPSTRFVPLRVRVLRDFVLEHFPR